MSSSDNRYPYLPGNRYLGSDPTRQISSPYDEDSRLFDDLKQREIRPVSVKTIDLSTAGSLELSDTGYHFVIYGHDGSSNKAVNTTAFVEVQINTGGQDKGYNKFPAKHARGFSGPFSGLYLSWPAQSGVYCDLIIYKSYERPWIDGESAT